MIRSGGKRRATRAQIMTSAARGVAARASPEQATRRTSGSGSPNSGAISSTRPGIPGRVSNSAARARVVGRREASAVVRRGIKVEASIAAPIAPIAIGWEIGVDRVDRDRQIDLGPGAVDVRADRRDRGEIAVAEHLLIAGASLTRASLAAIATKLSCDGESDERKPQQQARSHQHDKTGKGSHHARYRRRPRATKAWASTANLELSSSSNGQRPIRTQVFHPPTQGLLPMPRLSRRLLIPLFLVAVFAAIGVVPAAASALAPSTSAAASSAVNAGDATSARRAGAHVRRAWPAKKAHRPKTAITRWLARQVGPLDPVACAKRGAKARAHCAVSPGQGARIRLGLDGAAAVPDPRRPPAPRPLPCALPPANGCGSCS